MSPRSSAEEVPAITAVQAVRSLAQFPVVLVRHRDLIRTLVVRELRARYLASAIGGLWALINPLVMLAVYTLVFSKFLKLGFRLGNANPGETNHLLNAFFLFCGMVPWIAFAEGLHR